MTVLWWLLMVVAGSIGALCRWRMDLVVRGWAGHLVGAARRRSRERARTRAAGAAGSGDLVADEPEREYPPELALGIVTVNVVGCLLAGLFYGAFRDVASAWLVAGTGFLGGFTTFSTAMVDVLAQLRSRRPGAALGLLLGTWVLGIAACLAGLAATGAL